MNKLAVATNNKNKLKEINQLFEFNKIDNIAIFSINDLDVVSDPEETGKTLAENSLIKSKSLYLKTGIDSIADDTGLFVDFLDGKPGVKSARYASEKANDSENRTKLLSKLGNSTNRSAHFKTTICFTNNDITKYFEGICRGNISYKEEGDHGFGYDSIFIPYGYEITFAEMEANVKNKISHRSIALSKFINWYKNEYVTIT